MAIDYGYFKNKLETEKKLLEKELEKVGRRNPDNLLDWEAIPADKESSQADENVAADKIEGYEENVAIVNTLETRYQDIKDALDKIKQGTYGLCEVSGEEIEIERLEANPSARTCKLHIE
ncbi:MAG: TraR/DksA C4-type zinc finger protein [Candidatus Zambryskibacteria bacterium]|nr:TraR/DksA C4-type zinc finger protein [Candidatus Zambryskibacteria bacterium]